MSFKSLFIKPVQQSLLLAGIALASSATFAEAPGGPDCGWGNLMFEGDSGKVAHFGASIFNGSSGNAWIGMLFGTNGCTTDGVITYGGKSFFALKGFIDEVAVDVAQGDGEALDALTIVLGIDMEDRTAFKQLMHTNFEQIFPHPEMNSNEVLGAINRVMKQDEHFKRYASL